MTANSRRSQIILVVATLVGSWLAMQAIHECGHALAACFTGGRVVRVVLHPLTISRTDVSPNPRPLAVAWAGPLFGALAPLMVWLIVLKVRSAIAPLARFFAGFCLVANGLYLGCGSFDRVGDCGDLLNHGAAIWQLWLFGAVAAASGLLLWHGQGRHFGFARDGAGRIENELTIAALVFTVAALALGLVVGGA